MSVDDDDIPQPDRIEGAPHPRETFDLYGHAAAEAEFLDRFQAGRLHHAWMIAGPRGIGKATLAWRIARYLLAGQDRPTDSLAIPADAPVSKRMAALGEPGLFLCRRPWDQKTKRLKTVITVDEVRKLKGFFNLSSPDGHWRVAIIDAADEMNPSAANALLKILEEPPAKVVLLLVTHQPSKLLPTIRSRCRLLRCAPLAADDLGRALHSAGSETGEVEALAALSGGSPGEAIRLLARDGTAQYARVVRLIGQAPRMDRDAITALADTCAARGNAEIYDLVVRLLLLALTRLARFGATGQMLEAAKGETEIAARLCPGPHHARIWADLHAELDGRITHARAVNLDPGQVILDTCLRIESAARNLVA